MAYPDDSQYQPVPTRAPARFFDDAIQAIERRHGWKFTDDLRETLRERFAYMTIGVRAPELMQRDWQLVNQVARATRVEIEREAAVVTPLSTPTRRRAMTLDSLIERFSGDATRAELRPTTKGNYNAPFDILRDVLGGSADIRTITRDDIKRYRDIITWIPVNARRTPEFATMAYADIAAETKERHEEALRRLEVADIDDPTEEQLNEYGVPKFLMRSAVNKYLGAVSKLFQWAAEEGLLSATPAARIKLPPSGEKRKREFTADELRRLFHKDFALDSVSWMLIVSLHQGFRPSECAQLDAADMIQQDDGIHCFRLDVATKNKAVESRLRRDVAADKNYKNQSSRRVIPIHAKLVELGFVEYVNGRVAAGEQKMFNVKRYGDWGYYESARKQLVPLLTEAGVFSPATTLHSFRHTFAEALRQVAPEAKQIREAIGGWSVGGSSEIDYGSAAFAPATLKPWLDRVRFDGLFMYPRRD